MPAGRSSTSIPGSSPSSSGSVSSSRPSPPGKSVAATSVEVALHGLERLGEPRLDGPRQVVAQPLELLEAPLEIGALLGQLGQALLLGLVLLLGERVDLAQRLATLLAAPELLGELVAVLALGRLRRRGIEPALSLVVLGVDARELDVDRRQPLARLCCALPQLDLLGAEPAQLGTELAGARSLRFDPGAERRVERADLDGERRFEPLRAGQQPLEDELFRAGATATPSASASARAASRARSDDCSAAAGCLGDARLQFLRTLDRRDVGRVVLGGAAVGAPLGRDARVS